MIADTDEELHAMAQRIGLPRESFQNKRVPHYDLTAERRALAVQAGAVEITRKQMGLRTRAWKRRPL
jgi:hypothetical protein